MASTFKYFSTFTCTRENIRFKKRLKIAPRFQVADNGLLKRCYAMHVNGPALNLRDCLPGGRTEAWSDVAGCHYPQGRPLFRQDDLD
jgi:hypothetical protein